MFRSGRAPMTALPQVEIRRGHDTAGGTFEATGPGAVLLAALFSVVAVDGNGETVFERVGGQGFFDALVGRFYEGVEADAELRALYPEDLEPGKRHLALFLAQYWGGPPVYSDERGHPRLRARHLPFAIGTAERDAWVTHMLAALATADLPDEDRAAMTAYFEDAATFLINQHPLSMRPS